MLETPEQRARRAIDAEPTAAGWLVQDSKDIDLTGGQSSPFDQHIKEPIVDALRTGPVGTRPVGVLRSEEGPSAGCASGTRIEVSQSRCVEFDPVWISPTCVHVEL